MSRLLRMTAVLAFGATCAWPVAALAFVTSAPAGDVEVLRAYIDPGVAGFVIVTVLGFISSVGYWARSHIARVKQRLFGRRDSDASDTDDGESRADGEPDSEGGNC